MAGERFNGSSAPLVELTANNGHIPYVALTREYNFGAATRTAVGSTSSAVVPITGLGLAACTHAVVYERPPEQYANRPYVVTLRVADAATITSECRELGLPVGTVACASPYLMLMPNPCDWPHESFAQLMCHEGGHVVGWPAHHPR